ncbi:hypothetical protein A3H81_01435 [Candidatus Daviesbacteria bacterium RIFCSPLOWO2_02_FULL_38_18]|nr:MAG: hypothetical protein A3H81_01435 [Candidatus Daviesbacteria bacterium RIFCSPLOWO2_02_FULL_38_18]OGE72851.1 MAG: hypothetical protein A3H18_05275 [Candidatus Daviesbacteria bacterium RIFCSPLOWO2_12_FULL_38_10]HCB22527.1 hypothetical protein [Candidatus Daviesbacteria bacterium]
MKPEAMVAQEALVLLTRDFAKYHRNVVGMYLLSIYDMELGSAFRSGYYFVRHIDDVLDGDRQVSCDSLAYVQNLRSQVETGNYRNGSIATLAEHAINLLERKKKPEDDPRLDFLRSIDSIVFDYERARIRRVLTKAQLEDYYYRAFDPVVNLSLIGLTPFLRSRDIPIMSYGSGRVYSVRDLSIDWIKGIINLPKEVLERARLTTSSTLEEIQNSAEVQDWFSSVLTATRSELFDLQRQLKATQNGVTNFILGGKIKLMLRFIDMREHSQAQISLF